MAGLQLTLRGGLRSRESADMMARAGRRRSVDRRSSAPTFELREEELLPESELVLASSESEEDFLRLSVSGRRFRLLRSRLLRKGNRPPSRLEVLADAGISHSAKLRLSHGFLPDTRQFFFARSAALFDHILQAYYLFPGSLHVPLDACPESFAAEMSFWRLPFAALSPCCAVRMEHLAGRHRLLPPPPDRIAEEDEEAVDANGKAPEEGSPRKSLIMTTADDVEGAEELQLLDEFEGVLLKKPRRAVWDFMEDPSSSKAAKIFSLISVSIVLTSVLDLIVASLPEFQIRESFDMEPRAHPVLEWIEIVCIIWFTSEYLIRLVITPRKLEFLKNPQNVIDVLSVLPFYVELGLTTSGVSIESLANVRGALLTLRILRVLRVARIFKLAKYSGGLQSFGQTLKASYREIGMLLLFLSTTIVLFSTTVYFLEKDVEDTPFVSIPATFWWCIVTMTTVGYGDMVPVTVGGKMVASMTSVSGVIVLAFPITIIVENFNKYYRQGQDSRPASAATNIRPHSFGML